MKYAQRILLVGCVLLMGTNGTQSAEPIKLEYPQPYQVVQRTGVAPGAGFAEVSVTGTLPTSASEGQGQYRVVPTTDPKSADAEWKPLKIAMDGNRFTATVRVEAGGWYRCDIRLQVKEKTVAEGSVEPFGVGEVFIVAGQSYATNCNDEQFKVTDSQARVGAFDGKTGTWRVANDPQPAPDGSDGGSIWPPLGDALAKDLNVPIGFANVAYGGTSFAQWMPGGNLHQGLIDTGKKLNRFRAVLWQQGESDVIAKTTLEQYVANVQTIRDSAAEAWHFEPPWLLAKSTLHPTVYNDPRGENRIRNAIDKLTRKPGFRVGPDTDSLAGENRGDEKSRRHFSGIGQRRAAEMWQAAIRREVIPDVPTNGSLRVGIAETDITPPVGFPMAGYYHERLAEGTIDPLKAKAIVFRSGEGENEIASALVVCDLIGIATDLSREVRKRASEQTGIPASHIVISATHSHTAPDYMKELWLNLGGVRQEPLRSEYIKKLISEPVAAIVAAHTAARPAVIATGSATQRTPVSFNRRFVMRDGSVQTWQNLSNPNVVRAAGPIDPEIALLAIRDPDTNATRGVLSNFALHLDTVGGMKWSADYPMFIEQTLRSAHGAELISIFGTGCCGDINHSDPTAATRNKVDFIGSAIGDSIVRQLDQLALLGDTKLFVKSEEVRLPLQDSTREEVARSIEVVAAVKRKEQVDFLDHVSAYKKLVLDHFLHRETFANTAEHVTWGLSRSLAGIGETIPVDVTVMTLGHDVAIVCLPGEVFVELGLAIKQGSPFRTTLVIELSNAVETIYVPNRAAHAGGSYEVTNSALRPGSGEMLVETSLRLLREAAQGLQKK
jgi:Carbohydrate esterase, sialic acid-specific acetylesterase/Neutral/alkaline non-lysosomal ceramidase, N-terminal